MRPSNRRTASGAALLASTEDDPDDKLSALDHTIRRIGLGAYQYTDNMWLQCIAVILPRVQDEFAVGQWIGALSASIFGGMMIGAWGWGSWSDSYGRRSAFNGTLVLTAVFGLLAGFAQSFFVLCLLMFGLGIGIGGSMPTDGTLFLENIPTEKHYLLTGLSVFFAFGAVITSVFALFIIPSRSCPEDVDLSQCDLATQNTGWRTLLMTLGGLTAVMSFARIGIFRLHESPKWLVNGAGRSEDAVITLERIAKENGQPLGGLTAADVDDTVGGKDPTLNYDGRYSPVRASDDEPPPTRARSGSRRWSEFVPIAYRDSVDDYLGRTSQLFAPDLARTTLLTWAVWTLVSCAYSMFNVFLPSFLEQRLAGQLNGGRMAALWDYLLYTVASIPGSLVGAALVGTKIGQRNAMAMASAATAVGVLLFVSVNSNAAVVVFSCIISLVTSLEYAIQYAITPVLFPVQLRGTGCGIASALSRFAGICAPLITGILLSISPSLPLWTSAALFGLATFAMIGLPEP